MSDRPESSSQRRAPVSGALQRVPLHATTHVGQLPARCVLVVDDSRWRVEPLEQMLQIAGASSVEVVSDGWVAVARCIELRPDLVVVDLGAPCSNGLGLLGVLRRTLPDEGFLPLLVLTDETTKQTRDRALDAGANELLTRPYDQAEFVQRVSNLLTMRALYQAVQRTHH
jgi:putative two-component system response regulator